MCPAFPLTYLQGPLRPGEWVYHINGNVHDCRKANMVVMEPLVRIKKRLARRKKHPSHAF